MHPFFLFFVQIFTSTPQDKHKDDDLEEQDSSQISISKNNHSEEVKLCRLRNDNNGDNFKKALNSLTVESLYDVNFCSHIVRNFDDGLENIADKYTISKQTDKVATCKEQLKQILKTFDLTALSKEIIDESLLQEAKCDGERRIADESHSGSAITEHNLQIAEKLASIIDEIIFDKAFDRLKELLVYDFESYMEKIAEKDTDFLMKEVHETLIECLGPKNKEDVKELKRKIDLNDESNEISEKRLRGSLSAMDIN